MPEGPEVWILSKAINSYYSDNYSSSMGKHLFLHNQKEDWSFGMSGKVYINEGNSISKQSSGWLPGTVKSYTNSYDAIIHLGTDWMQATKEELETVINTWKTSNAKLASLLLDQSRISGIGVAWGSEILAKAGLRPDQTAKNQSLTNLADAMIEVRASIQILYENTLQKYNSKNDLKDFINQWFANLYEIRKMQVYKKSTSVAVGGRTWYTNT